MAHLGLVSTNYCEDLGKVTLSTGKWFADRSLRTTTFTLSLQVFDNSGLVILGRCIFFFHIRKLPRQSRRCIT